MSDGRTPAQVADSHLRTASNLSSHTETENEKIITHNGVKCQQFIPGNKCGHDRKNFRFYQPPKNQRRRYHVIEEAKRRIPKAFSNPFDYPEFHALLRHADKKGRRKRSERTEAECALLLGSLFDTVNLYHMEAGEYRPDGKFVNYEYEKLAALTKMNYSRVARNMRHLQKYKLITVHEIVGETDKGFRTKKVIISVTADLFRILNLDNELLEDRIKAKRSYDKIQHKLDLRKNYLESYRPKKLKESKKNKLENKNKSENNHIDSDSKRHLMVLREVLLKYPYLKKEHVEALIKNKKPREGPFSNQNNRD